jgi:acetyltransferase-like isoleucine patch superfamily enzyme
VIEKNVRMGAGVIVENGLKIGKNQKIAAGTVVTKNLEGLYRKGSK